MTDVKSSGRRRAARGLPLLLVEDAFERIATGRDELLSARGGPTHARIAKAAGVNKQRLSDINNGLADANINTLGALVRCYAKTHGVTDAEAMAVLLYVPEDDAEAIAA